MQSAGLDSEFACSLASRKVGFLTDGGRSQRETISSIKGKFPLGLKANVFHIISPRDGVSSVKSKMFVSSYYTVRPYSNVEIDSGVKLYSKELIGTSTVFAHPRFNHGNSTSSFYMDRLKVKIDHRWDFTQDASLYISHRRNLLGDGRKYTLEVSQRVKDHARRGISLYYSDSLDFHFGGFYEQKIFKWSSISASSIISNAHKNMKVDFTQYSKSRGFSISTYLNLDLYRERPTSVGILGNRLSYHYEDKEIYLGSFMNTEGNGLEIGYKGHGLNLSFPIVMSKFEMDRLVEFDLDPLLGKLLFHLGFNFLIRGALDLVHYLRKSFKRQDSEQRKEMVINRLKANAIEQKILEQIANKKFQDECNKGAKGLKILLGVYGDHNKLMEIYNEAPFVQNLQNLVSQYTKDHTNQVLDVTTALRFSMTQDEEQSILNMPFESKEEMLGVANPIYKSDSKPHLLIVYQHGQKTKLVLLKDDELAYLPYLTN